MQFNCLGTEAIERFTDWTSPAVDNQLALGSVPANLQYCCFSSGSASKFQVITLNKP
jgi:hypothetical protein